MEERKVGVDLLKCIAIVLIVIAHTTPSYGTPPYAIDFSKTTLDSQIIILHIFKFFGQIGNGIFIICSSYFLIDSNRTNLNKVLHLYCDLFCIANFFLFLTYWNKDNICNSIKNIIDNGFPFLRGGVLVYHRLHYNIPYISIYEFSD